MLAQAEMPVVFVLEERITLGSFMLTATKKSKSFDMISVVIKYHSDE